MSSLCAEGSCEASLVTAHVMHEKLARLHFRNRIEWNIRLLKILDITTDIDAIKNYT